MEELEFVEPDEGPRPPEEVQIERLAARVYPDGRRVRVDVKITPFLQRPNLEFTIFNAAGQPVASLSVIESMDHTFEMTAHLRGPQPVGPHTLRAELFYDPAAARRTMETTFSVPDPSA